MNFNLQLLIVKVKFFCWCRVILLYLGTKWSAKLSQTFILRHPCGTKLFVCVFTWQGEGWEEGKLAGALSIPGSPEACLCKGSGNTMDSGPQIFLNKACCSLLIFCSLDTPSFKKIFLISLQWKHFTVLTGHSPDTCNTECSSGSGFKT